MFALLIFEGQGGTGRLTAAIICGAHCRAGAGDFGAGDQFLIH